MRAPKLLVLNASEDLADQVERATAVLRPRPSVARCSDLASLPAALQASPGIDLLIAGPSVGDEEGLRALRRLRGRMANAGLVLAFDRWRSGSLRETIRTGALDILRLPVKDTVLAEAIEQALELQRRDELEGGDSNTPAGGSGTVYAVVSATGGCGKTFFAMNLAYHLQTKLQRPTCMIDLDLQFGELSAALRLKPRYTITDIVNGDEILGDDQGRRLHEYLALHDTGIRLLPAPNEPADADAIGAADIGRVLEAARARFDHVVIDTPASLSEAVLVALEHADRIFAIATLDLPSIRNLGVLLNTFSQLKVPSDRVELVLNKVEPDVGIDISQVTRYFPQGFSIVIPYAREVNRSLNMGMPMLAYAPRAEVSKVLSDALGSTLPGGPAASVDAPVAGRWLFGRRKRPA